MFSIKTLEGIQYEQNRIYGYGSELGNGIVRLIDEFAGCNRIKGWTYIPLPIPPIYYLSGNVSRFVATSDILFNGLKALAAVTEQLAIETNKNVTDAKNISKALSNTNMGNVVNDINKRGLFKIILLWWTTFRENIEKLKDLYSKLYITLSSIDRARADYYDTMLSSSFVTVNEKIKVALKEVGGYEKPKDKGIFDWIADLGKTAKFLTYAIPIGIGVYLIVPILSKKKER